MSIKAVSFDFWNTFAIPNPKYAEARTEFLNDHFGLSKADYTKVKKHLDHYAEVSGISVIPMIALSMLFPYPQFEYVHLDSVYAHFIEMFNEHPPILSDEIKESVDILHKKDIPWGITSNTNFISGTAIDQFLWNNVSDINLLNYDSPVFSDIVGFSKPSEEIFGKTLGNFYERDNKIRSYKDIMHIGDHPICDLGGANRAGMIGKLIKTPSDILKIMKEEI